jgi:hypothetical protein
MHSVGTSMTKRLATVVALAFVFFATALPGAAACCIGKRDSKMSAMHAAMPCCAKSCTMSNATNSRADDAALTPAPSPQPASSVGGASTSASIASGAAATTEYTFHEFAAPPPFLVNAQFRI